MRIPEQKPIVRVGPATETRVRQNAPVALGERVSTSDSDEVKLAAEAVRRELGSSRAGHLANIEAAVRSGSYRADPRVIAEKILQSAALDAEISAMLRGA